VPSSPHHTATSSSGLGLDHHSAETQTQTGENSINARTAVVRLKKGRTIVVIETSRYYLNIFILACPLQEVSMFAECRILRPCVAKYHYYKEQFVGQR
jgi:hypothetical protein